MNLNNQKYKSIFLDLDRTLWDFNRNSYEMLMELFDEYQLLKKGVESFEHFYQVYIKVNDEVWGLYDHGKITKEELRNIRFNRALKSFEITDVKLADDLSDDYITRCPRRAVLIDGALDILDYLREKRYPLYLITNGFEQTQWTKLKTSKIEHYFEDMVTSERAKAQKPYPEIFEMMLNLAEVNVHETIMIGDSWSSDIIGAQRMGIDQVYFNPEKHQSDGSATHEIQHLLEIKNIL